jgi:hypothetical protein
MLLQRYDSAAAFLAAAQPFLLKAEAENNLILGLAGDIAAGRIQTGGRPYFVAVVEGPEILLTGWSTVSDKVGVTRCDNREALSIAAADILLACPGMRLVLGPEPTAVRLAGLLVQPPGSRPRLHMSQRIHELREVASLSGLPAGEFRAATLADLDLMTEWVAEFMRHSGDHGDAGELAHDRIVRGLLYVWDTGRPVSMAAWTGKTPNGVRVNFVYTPIALRGRGYATACVAALSRLLLENNRFCCLYTDLANPTSNAIYYRIGYRPVCDAGVYLVNG